MKTKFLLKRCESRCFWCVCDPTFWFRHQTLATFLRSEALAPGSAGGFTGCNGLRGRASAPDQLCPPPLDSMSDLKGHSSVNLKSQKVVLCQRSPNMLHRVALLPLNKLSTGGLKPEQICRVRMGDVEMSTLTQQHGFGNLDAFVQGPQWKQSHLKIEKSVWIQGT